MDILKNRYNIFCILIVVMKSMCSCNSQDEQIKQFISTPINLQVNKMIFVGEDSNWLDKTNYIHVLYFDSLRCSSCLSNKLVRLHEFENKAKEIDSLYNICIVVSGNRSTIKYLKRVKYYSKYLPITYVDTTDVFSKNNPKFIKSSLYESFMIDKQGNVKVLGNPISNAKIGDLLLSVLKEHK